MSIFELGLGDVLFRNSILIGDFPRKHFINQILGCSVMVIETRKNLVGAILINSEKSYLSSRLGECGVIPLEFARRDFFFKREARREMHIQCSYIEFSIECYYALSKQPNLHASLVVYKTELIATIGPHIAQCQNCRQFYQELEQSTDIPATI